MTSFATALIIWGMATFALAAGAGFIASGARLWRYVDPFYYLLGACGVLLVALAVERNLVAERLQQDEAALSQAWKSQPNIKPRPELRVTGAEMVGVALQGLRTAKTIAEHCAYGPKYSCSVYRPIAEELAKAIAGFDLASPADEFGQARQERDFCRRAMSLVSGLSRRDDLLDGGAFHDLQQALAANAKTAASREQVKIALTRQIDRDQLHIRDALDDSQRETADALMSGFKNYALLTVSMVGFCADVSGVNDDGLRQIDTWQDEQRRRASSLAGIRKKIEFARVSNAKTRIQALSATVRNSLWPFILILAAAIKFGKSFADLRRAALAASQQKPESRPRGVVSPQLPADEDQPHSRPPAPPDEQPTAAK
jgi:hypothetical protein